MHVHWMIEHRDVHKSNADAFSLMDEQRRCTGIRFPIDSVEVKHAAFRIFRECTWRHVIHWIEVCDSLAWFLFVHASCHHRTCLRNCPGMQEEGIVSIQLLWQALWLDDKSAHESKIVLLGRVAMRVIRVRSRRVHDGEAISATLPWFDKWRWLTNLWYTILTIRDGHATPVNAGGFGQVVRDGYGDALTCRCNNGRPRG